MSLRELWYARPERERSALTAGAVVFGAMLVVALVWLPLERTRTHRDSRKQTAWNRCRPRSR